MTQQTGKSTRRIDNISLENAGTQRAVTEKPLPSLVHAMHQQSSAKQRSDRTAITLLIMLVMILSAALIGIL